MFTSLIKFVVLAGAFQGATACTDHDLSGRAVNKRAEGADWTYDNSYDWGRLNPNYTTCQIGEQQSPIDLSTRERSRRHNPTFNAASYSSVAGKVYNWGHGTAFTVDSWAASITSAPSFSFVDSDGKTKTLYLKQWHTHAVSDHSVNGVHSRSEIHFVHTDAAGKPAGVVGIRIDPGNKDSSFWSQVLPNSTSTNTNTVPSFDSTATVTKTMNIYRAFQQVDMLSDFWTYSGSLTTPPCTEGIRWFVARDVMYVGNTQMQEILRVSTFSSRVVQYHWLQGINE